jgi:hypothetical protein
LATDPSEPDAGNSLLAVDRGFLCHNCGAKWFIHEHRVSQPDLAECARCGGLLAKLGGDDSSPEGEMPDPHEGLDAESGGLDL